MEQTPQLEKPRKKPVIPIVIVIIVVAVLGFFLKEKLFGSIYERNAEQAFEKQTGGKADIDLKSGESSFEFETEEGKVVIKQDGALPDDFSDDLEIYTNAKVTSYVSMDSDDIKGFNTTSSTSDSKEDVYNFYLSSLPENGWSILSKMNSEVYNSISAKKDNRTVVVTITGEADETITVLTVKTD